MNLSFAASTKGDRPRRHSHATELTTRRPDHECGLPVPHCHFLATENVQCGPAWGGSCLVCVCECVCDEREKTNKTKGMKRRKSGRKRRESRSRCVHPAFTGAGCRRLDKRPSVQWLGLTHGIGEKKKIVKLWKGPKTHDFSPYINHSPELFTTILAKRRSMRYRCTPAEVPIFHSYQRNTRNRKQHVS